MSEFHSGEHRGVVFETYPLNRFNKKKPKFLWHLPYWTAEKVSFVIKIETKSGARLITDIPIFSKNSNSSFEADRIEENKNCVISDDGKIVSITTNNLRGSGVLEYFLGSPNTKGATTIVELQANWRDKKWFLIYGIIGGFIGSIIIFILGLLSKVISINVEWIVDLF